MKRTGRFLLVFLLVITAFSACAAETVPGSQVKRGDILCFGTPDGVSGFDGRWLVLDPEHTNTGTEGMFLVSLQLIGDSQGNPLLFRHIEGVSVSFSDRGEDYARSHPGTTDYQGSDIQRWCADFLQSHFSEAERQAILPTVKSDEGIVIPGFGIPLPGASAGTVDFDPAPGVLDQDKLFPLSAEEAVNEKYGFTDSKSRVALFKGTAEGYWLRSPHIPTFPMDVGFVFSFGAVMDYPVNAQAMFSMNTYARPACNLDSGRIAELEELSAADAATIWRVTFRGEEHNDRSYDLTLPEIGDVPDVMRIIPVVLIVAVLLLLALLVLAVWMVIRVFRRKRRQRS